MIQIKRSHRAFVALSLAFLPVFLAADLAHAEEESTEVSVTLTVDQQIVQAEITITTATSEIQVITENLASTSSLIEQLISGGSSSIASVSEVIVAATVAVEEASQALSSASEALWDVKEKQDSYELAVAASELADANLSVAQSSYSQAVVDLSSISAAVASQQAVVQQKQSELDALTKSTNSYEISSPGWTNSVEASTASSTSTLLPQMYDQSIKIDVPFDIRMGNTLYEGQGDASQIYVTSKAFISFGQPDFTFWDWPQTAGIYVYQSDWMTAGTGAYTKISTTENTLTVEWSLHRFGDSNGPLTNVIWNMIVDPATGEWTGYSEISGNTENLYGGPRVGVRYTNGGPIYTMSPKIAESVSAEIVEQQQAIVNSESITLANLQTEKNIKTVVLQEASASLAIAQSESSYAQSIEVAALAEFANALTNTQNIVSNLIIVVENAETKVQTAYIVTTNAIASLPAPTPAPEPVTEPEPQPTTEPSPEPIPTTPPVEPEPAPEPSEEPSPEPTPEPRPEPIPVEPKPIPTPTPTPEPSPEPLPTPKPTPLPEPKPEPNPEPKPIVPEKITPETPITKESVTQILSKNFEPKDLTAQQISQVVELANTIFASSEPGSEAYEQALDLLMVAAEADDVELSEELAAIPLLGDVAGAALEVFNNVGNIGADMSPEVREKAVKTVIASVIAAQAAIAAVASATATTASSGTRRI